MAQHTDVYTVGQVRPVAWRRGASAAVASAPTAQQHLRGHPQQACATRPAPASAIPPLNSYRRSRHHATRA